MTGGLLRHPLFYALHEMPEANRENHEMSKSTKAPTACGAWLKKSTGSISSNSINRNWPFTRTPSTRAYSSGSGICVRIDAACFITSSEGIMKL